MTSIRDGLNIIADHMAKVTAGIDLLATTRVMVGVPEDEASRQDGAMTNAALAYIHDNGAPEANIPARPFMRPGIARAQADIANYHKAAGELVFHGKPEAARKALMAAGQAAVNSIRATISEGIPPPLAQATVDRRRIRSKGSKYRRKATGPADVTPLVDTGQMRNAITYVIRKVPK